MTSVAAIVPVYNSGVYLRTCLDSILNQSRRFDEVIIVDDKSSDPLTIDILDSLECPAGVKIFYNQYNMGISATQNKAVALAESDYVAFIDCDDFLSETANESVFEALSGEIDYLFSDRVDINESGKHIRRYSAGDLIAGHPHGLRDLLLEQMVASHLKVIRRRTVRDLDGFATEFDGVQDWDFALRLSEFGRMVHVPLPLYFHRIHERQNTSTFRAVNFRRMNEVRRSALERRGIVRKKAPNADLRLQVEHAAGLMASTLAGSPDYRKRFPGGGFVLAWDGGPVHAFDLYDKVAAAGVRDGAVCLVVSDHSGRVGALRHLGICNRAFVGLAVLPNPNAINEAQKYNSYFDFLVHLQGRTLDGLAGYCWSGLLQYSSKEA